MPGGPSIASSRPPPGVARDQARHRRQLGVALEQVELNQEWLLGHLRAVRS